jgi:hypothetical protein
VRLCSFVAAARPPKVIHKFVHRACVKPWG